jgi:hypothetical protein
VRGVAVAELNTAPATDEKAGGDAPRAEPEHVKKRRTRRQTLLGLLGIVIVLLIVARLLLPSGVRWYVNRVLDQDPIYKGRIGDIKIALWRGAYSINDIRMNQVIGSVPAPLFSAKRLDLALEWRALLEGKVAGKVSVYEPEITFVDSEDPASDQTGAGGPWLQILSELFPFDINSATVVNGTVNFRATDTDPPVDVQLTELNVQVDNLTNVHDEVRRLVSTVTATGLAMGHAKIDFQTEFDPFSYNPTFKMGLKMLGLDVTKTNDLAKAYGQFDFEHGWFDLVVEIDAKEGQLEGYVKPLFRNLKIFTLKEVGEKDIFALFWEAMLGTVSEVIENQPRDQLATFIPVSGNFSGPDTDLLATLLNVLRNAFIRAYLPRLEGQTPAGQGMQFGRGSPEDPLAPAPGGAGAARGADDAKANE